MPQRILLTIAIALSAALSLAADLPRAEPHEVGLSAERLAAIDDIVARGIRDGEMPGCVVAIGRKGKLAFLKAYGDRQVEPSREPMTADTVFDMASITKPVATATSIMLLIEQGKLGLDDRVAHHIPEFGQNGKDRITVRQLLTHQGGLIPDNALKDYDDGPEKSMERIYALDLRAEPGTRFIYTDVGFIMLGDLVKRITGRNVHEFSQEHIFGPLGMTETGYLPREELRERAATTEQRDGEWIRGEVHDPRAYRLDGIAGHAGLFSTAEDLAVFAQMLLGRGEYNGRRILKPQTVELMTTPQQVSSGLRGLGWDMRTGYSSNRGDLFSPRAFGHGGFTGTTFWVDPGNDLFVIFLSNRLHPDGRGTVNPLAGRIGTVAAASIQDGVAGAKADKSCSGSQEALSPVLTGIDVLVRDDFAPLKGRKVGLITNHTGLDRSGRSTVELLHQGDGVELVTLFSPEHGFEGKLDVSKIGDTRDARTGLKVFSLYGETRKPTARSLQGIDTLVFDIQDIGARFYTYISTMGLAMQAAAEHDVRFVVLDRPNPINGLDVAGPVLDAGKESFVGFHTLPVRHGMTAGELAEMFKSEMKLDLDLQVVRMEGWRRGDFYDATGLVWVNPSPNMRNLTQALLYPGIGLLETTNLSVGRGTDTPFEVIGAPWLDGVALSEALNRANIPGVRFVPIRFTPDSSKFANQECGGVNILITDRKSFEPLRTGFTVAAELRRLHSDEWETKGYIRLLGNQQALDALLDGKSAAQIEAAAGQRLQEFQKRRAKHLLY